MAHIRPPSGAEFEVARRMVKAARLDPTTPLVFEHTLIAEMDRKVVGAGQIKHHPGCQELGSLVVLPDYRRQGIAAQLIDRLEALAERPLTSRACNRWKPTMPASVIGASAPVRCRRTIEGGCRCTL